MVVVEEAILADGMNRKEKGGLPRKIKIKVRYFWVERGGGVKAEGGGIHSKRASKRRGSWTTFS